VAGDRPAAHARSGYGARVRRNLLLALLLAAVSVSATLAAAEKISSRARAEHGVAVLDLRKALEPVVNARGFGAAFFVHVEARAANPIGHMNPSGNRIAAEAIAAAVRALPASGV